jgi:hypothetical protein
LRGEYLMESHQIFHDHIGGGAVFSHCRASPAVESSPKNTCFDSDFAACPDDMELLLSE